MASTFPEPIKGEANDNVVLGTPAVEAFGRDVQVTGIALTSNPSKGSCKRRCCIGTGITMALLATMGIGMVIGYFLIGRGEEDGQRLVGRSEEDYEPEPEMGGFLTLSVANASHFLEHPFVQDALSTGIASLHADLNADDILINEIMREDAMREELDDLGRRLQPAPEEQHVNVLYTVRRDTVEQAQEVLEVMQSLPADTVLLKLRTAAQKYGMDSIAEVVEPKFCMVWRRRQGKDEQKNLRGRGERGDRERGDRERGDRERGERGRGDGERRRPGGEREDDEDDDEDRRLQPREGKDDKDRRRPFPEDCDWAERIHGKGRHDGEGDDSKDDPHEDKDDDDEEEEEEEGTPEQEDLDEDDRKRV